MRTRLLLCRNQRGPPENRGGAAELLPDCWWFISIHMVSQIDAADAINVYPCLCPSFRASTVTPPLRVFAA
ncbi:hypothetical protein L596_000069 [Steinernema carpocapsae]|uniref:Uncharacterized protein n=1 Tax=Steinernema carpocapsae TaxID=34508 RepID=A0A4U8UH31_STECR|nr:hypothetical protein L596_000069 [Steinernema carpocapsae]